LIPILTYKDLVFRGKTGTYINTSNAISWLIGRCERGDHTFYFATMFRQALNEFDVSNIRKTNIELSGKILSELKPE
jgi:beta-lactamase class D